MKENDYFNVLTNFFLKESNSKYKFEETYLFSVFLACYGPNLRVNEQCLFEVRS